jgi:GntR family transcriptional regulator
MTDSFSTYHRLQHDLSNIIETSPPGTKLPSEPKLAKKLGVSRATLREAMRTFESQGLLRRRQGLGTFVAGPKQIIESGLEVLESIETLAENLEMDVAMGELTISNLEASPLQADKLDLNEGDPLTEVRRVILTNQTPVAYLIDILPEHILNEKMLTPAFTGSVLDLLIKIGSPQLSISKTEISAINAPTDVAKALEIQRGDTLLLLYGLLYDKEGSPIDLSYSYFLPGHFRLHIIRKIGGINA